MIGLCASTSIACPVPAAPVGSTLTFISLKAGMYFDTGSSSDSLPRSTSVIAATLTMGLVME